MNRGPRFGKIPGLLSVWLMLALAPTASLAHPLGQNAYNREVAIVVERDRLDLHYLLDLAEIPTLAIGETADVDRDGQVSDAEWSAYTERWSRTLPEGLVVEVGGQRLPLTLETQTWTIAPGQSGLSTMRLQAQLSTPLELGEQSLVLDYRDQTRVDRLGWKEVWISPGKGVRILSADVPEQDRSKALTDFTPRAEGPPALLAAHAEIALAAPGTVRDDITATPAPGNVPVDIKADAKAGSARPLSTAQGSPIWSFFRLGVHHIATGWDHLMFLFGLVLLSGSIRQLVKTVTAFTLAHSVTLALAAQGLVRPPGAWVEALIAATIAYVGLVALLRKKNNHGAWLAFGFGLIHGFGFAGALAESLGSSNSLRLLGLVAFNLGIEAFQLILVCATVPLLRRLARLPGYGTVYLLMASSVFLAGAAWFLLRTIGQGPQTVAGLALVGIGLVGFLMHARRHASTVTQV